MLYTNKQLCKPILQQRFYGEYIFYKKNKINSKLVTIVCGHPVQDYETIPNYTDHSQAQLSRAAKLVDCVHFINADRLLENIQTFQLQLGTMKTDVDK